MQNMLCRFAYSRLPWLPLCMGVSVSVCVCMCVCLSVYVCVHVCINVCCWYITKILKKMNQYRIKHCQSNGVSFVWPWPSFSRSTILLLCICFRNCVNAVNVIGRFAFTMSPWSCSCLQLIDKHFICDKCLSINGVPVSGYVYSYLYLVRYIVTCF